MSVALRARADGTRPSAWTAGAGIAGTLLAAVAAITTDDRLRGALLAVLLVLLSSWIALHGRLAGRSFTPASTLLGVALLLLVAFPAVAIQLDPGILVEGGATTAGIAILAIGAAAILVGLTAASGRPAPASALPPSPAAVPALDRGAVAGLAAVPVLALVAFVAAVGGPVEYLSHLDETGARTAGLTYLIWGLLFAKYAVLARLAMRWRAQQRPSRPELVAAVLALLLIAGIGTRLLIVIALLQAGITYMLITGRRLSTRTWVAGVLAIGIVFVGFGELRRYQGLVAPGKGFPAYLVDNALPSLPATYVNQYADAVRLAGIAQDVVPERADYERGRELLRIVLQPIPGGVRPEVGQAPALRAAFTSGDGNGNALPLPVVGFIQFGVPGTVVLCLALGALAGASDRHLRPGLRPDTLLALVAAGTGTLILFRGTLVNAVAFTLMDVIGLFVAARALERLTR